MPEFNTWYPTSQHGTNALNVKSFGAIGDGIGHTLGTTTNPATDLPYATLPEAQADFPSATSLSDYVDWCALTECFKHAFQHETSPGVWVPNATQSELNRPVFIPSGRYVIDKPLHWNSIQGGWIYGGNAMTNIHNEVGTPGASGCVITNGFSYCRVENITFGTVGGEAASHAFDLNWGTGALVATNACIFINCFFSAPMGIGFSMADPASFPGSGLMSSEVHFYHCNFGTSAIGIYIANWNALNYSFIGCGGTGCDIWMQISAGGDVTIINGSLAANGWDIDGTADKLTVISTRTESKKFYRGGNATIISSVQTSEGREAVFCEALAPVILQNCVGTMSRVYGAGPIAITNCDFSGNATFLLTSITASPTAPLIRVSFVAGSTGSQELWYDGDECLIELVTGTGAASINGVWTVIRNSLTSIDLAGSVYGGTYSLTGHWTGAAARIRIGPRYYLRNLANLALPNAMTVTQEGRCSVVTSLTRNFDLLFVDSGKVFDNYRATGTVTITLPPLMSDNKRGARYEFVVLAAHTLVIKVNPETIDTAFAIGSPRIVEATTTTDECTEISSNVVGSTLELYLSDHDSGSPETFPAAKLMGMRWVVIKKTGTWTRAGTPVPD